MSHETHKSEQEKQLETALSDILKKNPDLLNAITKQATSKLHEQIKDLEDQIRAKGTTKVSKLYGGRPNTPEAWNAAVSKKLLGVELDDKKYQAESMEKLAWLIKSLEAKERYLNERNAAEKAKLKAVWVEINAKDPFPELELFPGWEHFESDFGPSKFYGKYFFATGKPTFVYSSEMPSVIKALYTSPERKKYMNSKKISTNFGGISGGVMSIEDAINTGALNKRGIAPTVINSASGAIISEDTRGLKK